MDLVKASVEYEERISFPQSLVRTSSAFSAPLVSNSSYPSNNCHLHLQFTANHCYNWLEQNSDSVMQYEDEELLKAGRKLIPLDELTSNAKKCLQDNKTLGKESKFDLRDILLVELLNWFHDEFFTWVDRVPCKMCGRTDAEDGWSHIDRIDAHTMAEKRYCCGVVSTFYRYNDVAKLLGTRQGRCGEFANAFTFFCRCLDYDARLVIPSYSITLSGFDHVWTEVSPNSFSHYSIIL